MRPVIPPYLLFCTLLLLYLTNNRINLRLHQHISLHLPNLQPFPATVLFTSRGGNTSQYIIFPAFFRADNVLVDIVLSLCNKVPPKSNKRSFYFFMSLFPFPFYHKLIKKFLHYSLPMFCQFPSLSRIHHVFQ